jgi:hypothetical protein
LQANTVEHMKEKINKIFEGIENGNIAIHDAQQQVLDLFVVSGRSEQLKTKFGIGQEVIVCGELHTKITRIDGENYYFLDENGKEWQENENAIEAK